MSKHRYIKPHQVRGRELEEVREKDPDGRIVYHHRTVDTLGRMLPRRHHRSGDARCRQGLPGRVQHRPARPGSEHCRFCACPAPGGEPDLNERQLHTRCRVNKAMAAYGRISSPAGSCVWHVIGLQRSVREWPAGRANGGKGDPGSCTRDVGGTVRIRCGQARLLKDACASWTTAFGSKSRNRQWPPQPPFVTPMRKSFPGDVSHRITPVAGSARTPAVRERVPSI